MIQVLQIKQKILRSVYGSNAGDQANPDIVIITARVNKNIYYF